MALARRWRRRLGKLRRTRELARGRIVVHKGLLKGIFPDWIVLPALCGHAKGRLRCPADLTIVTVHNRPYETLFERSVRYVGASCRAVRLPPELAWRHTLKLSGLLDFLRKESPTEYVFFCDADDCVLRDDPALAVALLEERGCDLLFSASGNDTFYEFMPEVRDWLEASVPLRGESRCYLGSGVFVGRWRFLERVLADALSFVRDPSDPDAPRPVAWDPRFPDSIIATERFPLGVEDDEAILRWLQPRYHPWLQVDDESRLSLRTNHEPPSENR